MNSGPRQPGDTIPREPAAAPQAAASREAVASWEAALSLGFEVAHGRTRMRRRGGHGPLYVQKPFYPEQGTCHLYLLHPPGGIVGGDRLTLEFELASGAEVLTTTPAATKFYRSGGPVAQQRQRFRIASGATLEWLPQDTLLFSGSRVESRTDVLLAPGARYLGWELNCLGRPASGDDYRSGVFDQRIALFEDGAIRRPLLLEHNRWSAGDALTRARWGLGGSPVSGSLYAYPADPDLLALARRRLASGPTDAGLRSGLTLVNGVLIGRVQGAAAEPARQWLIELWKTLRPLLLQRPPSVPRIWNT